MRKAHLLALTTAYLTYPVSANDGYHINGLAGGNLFNVFRVHHTLGEL
jgi:hypothetical protein